MLNYWHINSRVLHVNICGQKGLAEKKVWEALFHSNKTFLCVFSGGIYGYHGTFLQRRSMKAQIWHSKVTHFHWLALGFWVMFNGCAPCLEPTFSPSEEHHGGTWACVRKFNEGWASGVQSYLLTPLHPTESSNRLLYNTQQTQKSCPERTEVRLF